MITLTGAGRYPKSERVSRYDENAPAGAGNTTRGLTNSSDFTRERLAMKATRLCSIPSCDQPHKGRGLCDLHLQRLRRTGTTDSPVKSQEQRFWEKVDRRGPDECWPWTAATNEHGYGVLRPAGRRTGPTVKAHRYSAELAGMDIEGRHVLHSCDNPPCVNPAHLRPGTDADNMADLKERGRHVGNRKLTADEVRAIRARLAAGELHRVIADDFGVSRPAVSVIASGKAWRGIA